jgi:hypothetical protein
MSQRGGFAGSGHDLWRREPARADADWEEGDEVTSDESPDAYRWGPYPFSTYSLDNEFPAATRHLARKECAREFRRYYETLQVPNVHLGCSLMSFGFMLRLLKPVLFPGVNTPVEEGWEYISDGCRVTHILENAVPWVVTVFLLRFGFRAHPGTGRLLSPPHVFWYHMMMILLTAGSSAVRPDPRTHPEQIQIQIQNPASLQFVKRSSPESSSLIRRFPYTFAEAHAAVPGPGRHKGGAGP